MNNSNLSIRSLSEEEMNLIGGGNVEANGRLIDTIGQIIHVIVNAIFPKGGTPD